MRSILFVLMMMTSSFAFSDDLQSKTDKLCDKVKTCSLEQMGQQDLPEEMKAMMMAMFESTCSVYVKPYIAAVDDAGLAKKADKCMDSFIDKDCSEIMSGQDGVETPECKEYEAAAEEAGIKTN